MKNASIIYFLTRSLFLGFGISLLFFYSGKDSYLGAILGVFIGLIITYFYNYIIKVKDKLSLEELYKKDKIVGKIAKIMLLLASIIILIYALVLYVTFTISFLLVSTPEFYVLIPFLILAFILAYRGLKIISRVANSLLVISLVFTIFAIFGLSVFFEWSNFTPVLTTTPLSFLKTVITFAGVSTFPNILSLHFNNKAEHNMLIYIIAAISIILGVIFINGALGENLTRIFRFPEYMVLKQLKIFRFIEKVENIFSLVWVIDGFITASMAIYSIKEAVPKKYNKISVVVILLICAYLVDWVFGFNYKNELRMYYILPYLSFFMAIIMIFPFMYLAKKKLKDKHQ